MNDESTKQIGVLYRHFPDRGFGFLRMATTTFDGRVVPVNDKTIPDIFCHFKDCIGCDLVLDAIYAFETGTDRKSGKPKATNVKRVENG